MVGQTMAYRWAYFFILGKRRAAKFKRLQNPDSKTRMSIISLIGVGASVLTSISLLPQLVKIIKEKKAEDVSLGMMLALFGGLGLWVAYGIMKEDYIIIVANSFSFLVNLVLAVFAIKYKKERRTA